MQQLPPPVFRDGVCSWKRLIEEYRWLKMVLAAFFHGRRDCKDEFVVATDPGRGSVAHCPCPGEGRRVEEGHPVVAVVANHAPEPSREGVRGDLLHVVEEHAQIDERFDRI